MRSRRRRCRRLSATRGRSICSSWMPSRRGGGGAGWGPFLWKEVRGGLSGGWVQAVALRLVVEREREIQGFVRQEYWTIEAALGKEGAPPGLRAKLAGCAG